jgi:hypothetical protein
LEPSRTILAESGMQATKWPLVIDYTIYTRNRSPSKSCGIPNQVPIQIWYQRSKPPHVAHLRIFGERCIYHVPVEYRNNKLQLPGAQGIFVGYDMIRHAYRIATGTGIISVPYQLVKFYATLQGNTQPITALVSLPKKGPYDQAEELRNSGPQLIQISQSSISQSSSTQLSGSQPTQTSQPVIPAVDLSKIRKETNPLIRVPYVAPEVPTHGVPKVTRSGRAYRTLGQNVDGIPRTIREMGRLPISQKDHFIEAIRKEWQAYIDLGVFTLVSRSSLPANARPIASKSVFAIKLNEKGEIIKYKYRVTPKGFLQQFGRDFNQTASPTGSMVALRILMTHAVHHDWEIDSADVITAFLRAGIGVDSLYAELPQGLHEILGIPLDMVMHIHKSMPGLKQSSYEWNAELHNHLVNVMGLTQSPVEPCVYLKYMDSSQTELIGAIHVYVDDNTYFGPRAIVDEMKAAVSAKFPQVDNGAAEYILGLQIERNRAQKFLILHQSDYIEHILQVAVMSDCKPLDLPAAPHTKLTSDMCPASQTDNLQLQRIPYRSVVGSLLHLVMNTRPDIAYAVSQVCRFTSNYGVEHWNAVKQILRYLKGTPKLGIRLTGDPSNLLAYSDSDWAGDLDTRRSHTGFLIQLGGSPVIWKSKLQPCTTRSSFAAESVALASAADELLWTRCFLRSLGYRHPATMVNVDNQSVIATLNGHKCPTRIKHVEVRFHWLKEHIGAKELHVTYCSTDQNVSDIFTKPLGKTLFYRHREALNLHTVSDDLSP